MSLLRIDEIFNFEKGVLQSSKCVPGEYDFITASSDWKTHNEYTHECEALIFAAAASGSLGRTHYVNGKFISSDLCFIITPKDQENLPVDLKFYHILFNELKDEIVRNTKAGTSKEAIGLGSFGKYQLPYFDIDTQIEIKNRFVNAEELKSELSSELLSQVDIVKKLRQQLLQDAVQGKLVEQNPKDEPASELLKKIKAEKEKLIAEKKLKKEKELPPIKPSDIPFEIPENWIWCRFSEVVNIESNLVSPFDYPNSPHIAPDNIEKNTGKLISYKTVAEDNVQSANHYFYSGQLIYSKVRPKLNKVVKVDFEGLCSADMYPLRPLVNTDYIQKCMLSGYFLIEVDRFDNRVKMPKINQNQLSQIPIPLPPLAEQNRIVHKLDELMQYCNELEASIKQSESQNEKLLQQVLREALRKEPVEA